MHTECGTGPVSALTIPLNMKHESCTRYPLRGVTILLVEDSRLASEAFRMMCVSSGARIRRADSIRSAQRHLQTYRPHVAIVDMGLPDGSGAVLLDKIRQGNRLTPALIGLSGDSGREAEAMAAGADSFILKPVSSISAFQAAVLGVLPDAMRPKGLRVVSNRGVGIDQQALQDDLHRLENLLAPGLDDSQHDYAVQFLTSLATSAADPVLAAAAHELAQGKDTHVILRVRSAIYRAGTRHGGAGSPV